MQTPELMPVKMKPQQTHLVTGTVSRSTLKFWLRTILFTPVVSDNPWRTSSLSTITIKLLRAPIRRHSTQFPTWRWNSKSSRTKDLAQTLQNKHRGPVYCMFDRVHNLETHSVDKPDTLWNVTINQPIKSLKGELILFKDPSVKSCSDSIIPTRLKPASR